MGGAAGHNQTSTDAGWSSLVARRAHNPKVAGSNPAPATNRKARKLNSFRAFVVDGTEETEGGTSHGLTQWMSAGCP